MENLAVVHALVVVENTAAKVKEVMSGGESGVKLADGPFCSAPALQVETAGGNALLQ